MSTETPAEHLRRSLQITASARFQASLRLRRHEAWSLWSISLASAGSIVLSLLGPFDVRLVDPHQVDLMQVVASLVILLVSILVNGSKFGERAEKMHRCALELNDLAQQIDIRIQSGKKSAGKLDDFREQKFNILARYENHRDSDYFVALSKKGPPRPYRPYRLPA